MTAPTLYLCLDLMPAEGAGWLDGDIPQLLIAGTQAGAAWTRNWAAFTDIDEAKAYVASHTTLVLMPIVAEIIPLDHVH